MTPVRRNLYRWAMLSAALSCGLLFPSARADEPKREQCLATVCVSETHPGKPAVVLSRPKVRYVAGEPARIEIHDGIRTFELEINALPNTKPAKPTQHELQARITDTPAAKPAKLLAAPKLRLTTGQTGSITVGNLTLAATIEPAP